MSGFVAFCNSVWAWFCAHWLYILIGLVILVLICFLIILPLLRKRAERKKKKKETEQLKKDLMVWEKLNKLARGGKESEAAKEEMASRIGAVNFLFDEGMKLLKELNRKTYDLPWYVVLGEPASGKSSVLRNSSQDMCSSIDMPHTYDAEKSIPLQFCVLPTGVFLDVSGRVFFDRWMNGSGAEWARIVKLIRKKRSRFPLNGIVLTIPADALLADDEMLVRKKAALISSEQSHLIRNLGMLLPCHVVVTKCDMLPGFREYFGHSETEFREQIFGWVNEDVQHYDEEAYQKFVDETYGKMVDSRCRRILGRQFNDETGTDRGSYGSGVYVFPEEFQAIQKNLCHYLKGIFGTGNLHASEKTSLTGVFFTSSVDTGICLDQSCAKACNKPVDDTQITKRPDNDRGGVFIAALLKDVILSKKYKAFFTDKELRIRHIPRYILCCILILIGLGWLFCAFLQTNFLKLSVENQSAYYKGLQDDVQGDINRKSPLIVEKDGKWQLDLMSPRANDKNMTKNDFYLTELEALNSKIDLPVGFMLSSLFLFGETNYPGQDQKAFIHDQILIDVLVVPLGKAMASKMLQTDENTPVSHQEGKMLNTLSGYFENTYVHQTSFHTDSFLRPFLDYVFPDLPVLTLEYLDTWVPGVLSKQELLKINSGFLETDVLRFMEKSVSRLMKNWEKQNVYPEEKFGQFKQLALLTDRISDSYKALDDLPIPPEKSTLKDLTGWFEKYEQMLNDIQQNGTEFCRLAQESGLASSVAEKKCSEIEYRRTVQCAYDDWSKLLERDEETLNGFLEVRKTLKDTKSFEINLELWHNTVQEKSQDEKAAIQVVYKQLSFLLDGTSGLKMDDTCLLNQWLALENLALQGCKPVIDQSLSLEENWQQNEQRLQLLNTEFQQLSEQMRGDIHRKWAVDLAQKHLLVAGIYSRGLILDHAVERLPKTDGEVVKLITKNIPEKKLFGLDAALVQKAIGKVDIQKEYNLDSSQNLFADVAALIRYSAEPSVSKKTAPADGAANAEKTPALAYPVPKKAAEINAVFRKYSSSYLKYWLQYAPGDFSDIKTYAEFHDFASKIKTYQTNDVLKTIYTEIISNLNRIPPCLLTTADLEARNAYIAKMNGLLHTMNDDFSTLSLRSATNWALLPDDPLKAWDVLQTQSSADFMSNFMAVTSVKKDALDNFWWTKFLTHGFHLLMKEARQIFVKTYADRLMFAKRFPLCASAIHNEKLTQEEVLKFKELTSRIAPDPMMTVKSPLFALYDKKTLGWSRMIRPLVDALTGPPLSWTLIILSKDEQSKMCEKLMPDLPMAMPYFRYLTVTGDDTSKPTMISTIGGTANVAVFKGKITGKSLELRFSEFSRGDNTAAYSIKFDGGWAPLQLMFEPKADFDEKNSTAYIPLLIKDAQGREYVYCIGVQYSKEIPSPKKWPRASDIPNAL